jgi:UDP:flavonoid glycosyltransferase YjiC (YdhE family)
MISSNGSGMGHLTRLLAYAQRRDAETDVRFLSLSQAVPIVGQFGYAYEYLPSMTATGLAPTRWQDYFAVRVTEAIDRLRPDAVVFDGTVPYEGIPDVREAHPAVPWVWSRRGMWYRGYNREQVAKSTWFDLVVEPGDFAAAADRGLTATASATRVGPVTLLDRDDLDDRATARAAMGLAADQPSALVTLGAGNINDAASDVRVVIDALRARGMQVCVTKPAIAERVSTAADDVRVVSEYPLSRRYAAFDLAVSAAGYNSLHELLRFGVPTLFIPNLDTSLDDQRARARYVAEQRFACAVDTADPAQVGRALDELLGNGEKMKARVAEVDPGNGAAEVMRHVEQLIETVRRRR